MDSDAALLTGPPLPLAAGPESPPTHAPATTHLAWCEAFGLYCARQIGIARKLNLPTDKWLRAAELAGSIWRERAEGVTP
jgi:hypothetical protein